MFPDNSLKKFFVHLVSRQKIYQPKLTHPFLLRRTYKFDKASVGSKIFFTFSNSLFCFLNRSFSASASPKFLYFKRSKMKKRFVVLKNKWKAFIASYLLLLTVRKRLFFLNFSASYKKWAYPIPCCYCYYAIYYVIYSPCKTIKFVLNKYQVAGGNRTTQALL